MSTVELTRPTGSQAQLFAKLRRRLLANSLRVLVLQSRLRLMLVFFLSALIWGALYWLFADGFRFLRNMEAALPISHRVIELFFGMFFLSLTALMVFSTGLLLYGNLFRSPETAFLLSTPATTDRIFAYKFQEALLYSGWGFLLLGTPLLVAYGIEMRAAWYYYLLFPPYLLGFLAFPGAIGALACLLIVTYLPHRRRQALLALSGLVFLGLGWWTFSAIEGARDGLTEAWLKKLIDHLRPAQLPYLPSRWMTRGLMGGAAGELGDSLFYLALVWSNGLFAFLASAWAARRLYRRAFNRVASAGGPRRRYAVTWTDRLLDRLLRWTDPRTRIFIVKDFRTFRRDPVQWAQVLIFILLLSISFLSIPSLPYRQYTLDQRSLVGLLNLVVLGLMLATYTSRFVFPMMSMEGTKFWILGLLPMKRDRLLWSKFAYASVFTTAVSALLALLSEVMLGLPGPIVLLHILTMIVMAIGLSGISVGLGAYLVDLKENNPSKIATGFGGTLNLLVNLLFVVVVVLLAGLPTLLYFADVELQNYEQLDLGRMGHWLALSVAALVLTGLAAVFIPLALGIRRFRRMEF